MPAERLRPAVKDLRSVRSVTERVEEPPVHVRAPVEQRFGVDLSDVPVHRGPGSASQARRLRARAFTAGGEVHVPADHGPLDTGHGRGLLMHELVHAAQQRELASRVPPDSTGEARALEAQAQAFELASRGTPGAVPLTQGAEGAVLPLIRGAPEPQRTVVQRAAEGAEAPTESAGPELTLDALIGRLYEQFSSRLRAELLLDRERAGMLVDR